MKRLLITGSRYATQKRHQTRIGKELIKALNELGGEALLVHGAAVGVDYIAAGCWKQLHLPAESHPARWAAEGNAAGPLRNQRMVDLGADLCLAFYIEGVESRGTTDCHGRAVTAGIPVRVVNLKALK